MLNNLSQKQRQKLEQIDSVQKHSFPFDHPDDLHRILEQSVEYAETPMPESTVELWDQLDDWIDGLVDQESDEDRSFEEVDELDKGDSPGHPFRGNQYVDGEGGSSLSEEEKASIKQHIADHGFPSKKTLIHDLDAYRERAIRRKQELDDITEKLNNETNKKKLMLLRGAHTTATKDYESAINLVERTKYKLELAENDPDTLNASQQYKQALDDFSRAAEKWQAAKTDFRSRKIGDAEYFKARDEFKLAEQAMNQAEKKEQNR